VVEGLGVPEAPEAVEAGGGVGVALVAAALVAAVEEDAAGPAELVLPAEGPAPIAAVEEVAVGPPAMPPTVLVVFEVVVVAAELAVVVVAVAAGKVVVPVALSGCVHEFSTE